jgi:hypothetical protein
MRTHWRCSSGNSLGHDCPYRRVAAGPRLVMEHLDPIVRSRWGWGGPPVALRASRDAASPASRGQARHCRRRSEAVSCWLVVGVPGSLVGEAESTCPGARPLIATKTSFFGLRGGAQVAHSRGAYFDHFSPSLRRRPRVASFFSLLRSPPSCGPTHLGGRRTRSSAGFPSTNSSTGSCVLDDEEASAGAEGDRGGEVSP